MYFIKYLTPLCAAILLCTPSCNRPAGLTTFPIGEITVTGELHQRMDKNLTRLQEDIYLPPHVFEDLNWPGDFIGRTILGLTLEQQALHTRTELLRTLIDSLPAKLNSKGYLGPDYSPVINEQQLSGHGWLLRGLCEYYKAYGDDSTLPIIKSISENLFAANCARYASYPIEPEQRSNTDGQPSGTISEENPDWMLSTDIGCIFIGMAGLIDAYEILPSDTVAATIDELVEKFLEVDLDCVQAQTHATLSALRGLIKYSRLTADKALLDEVTDRWELYVREGMTCCFANLNWFGRPDSWTEPCAIVDSYIVAFELWKETHDPSYRDIAELIYCNALCHAQRSNGGFGCDNCPSEDNPFLTISTPEAYWCCTMRGAEGLERVAESGWALDGRRLYVPFFRNGRLDSKGLRISQTSSYPLEGKVEFIFEKNAKGIGSLLIPNLPWAQDLGIKVNGSAVTAVEDDGFLRIDRRFKAGDKVQVEFGLTTGTDLWNGLSRIFKGPLQMGIRGRNPKADGAVRLAGIGENDIEPVANLMQYMDSDCIQVLFR